MPDKEELYEHKRGIFRLQTPEERAAYRKLKILVQIHQMTLDEALVDGMHRAIAALERRKLVPGKSIILSGKQIQRKKT